jgi:hypothetical protein
VVRDRSGQALGYFYFEEEPRWRAAAKLLTKDEAVDRGQRGEVAGVAAQGAITHSPEVLILPARIFMRGRGKLISVERPQLVFKILYVPFL